MKPILLSPFLAALLSAGAALWPGAPLQAKAPEPGGPLTLHVATDREQVYRGGSREVVVQVELQGQRPKDSKHSPLNVSVVLDHSGSMSGAKIEKARQAACMALDSMEEDDYFSLVIYDTTAEVLLPPEKVGSARHRERLKEVIEKIRPAGSTALFAGVQLGASLVRKHLDEERVNRIILLSDGLANVGPSSVGELAKLGIQLGQERLSVTTIGLGDDFNENLMTALAEASHANYYYVRDAEKLPGIFQEELGAVGSKIAANVTIRIEVPKGVHVHGVLGHPELKSDERQTQIVLPELFGSERRVYHLSCTVDPDAAETLELAQVALSYEDASTKQKLTQNGKASVRFTDDRGTAEKSVRDEVAQQVTIVQNRLDKEKAVALMEQGKTKEATDVLRGRWGANSAAPAARQVPNVAEENRKLKMWADELETKGALSKSGEKSLKLENYQDKYQKR